MELNKFESAKNLYNSFLEDMKTAKIANSPKRYVIELNLLKGILIQAKAYNMLNEIEEYTNKVELVKDKLKNDFRVTIAD